MKNIKVSIVIPVYNIERYLSKCIDSVINQTYKIIEIILVDDGSDDNSGKICDDYAKKDKRISVIHQKNSGVSTSRNNGINKASGDYVTFIDSDDVVHPDYVKKLVDNLKDNSLSICMIEKFQNEFSFSKDTNDTTLLDKNNLIKLCELSLLNTPCCKLYNLEIIKKNKISFNTKLSLGEDLLFNLDYLKYIESVIVVNQKLYYYRRGDMNTLSTLYYPNILDIQLLLFDKYTEFFNNKSMDKNELTIFDTYRFSIIMVIVTNEFANGSVGFMKRYSNAKELLKNNKMKESLKEIKYPKEKFLCFLIKHRLVLTYRILNKMGII